jgi:hypothetical protein
MQNPNHPSQWHADTSQQASISLFVYCYPSVNQYKKPFSLVELQRQLGHKLNKPIWYMMQKLRKTMGISDKDYQLDKIVELDEIFLRVLIPNCLKKKS